MRWLPLAVLLLSCRTSELRPDPALASPRASGAGESSAGAMRRAAPEPVPPAEASAPAPEAPAPEASAPLPGGCKIKITGVISADVFRGPGSDSPMRQKTMERLSPEERARWHGRDHGLKHLRCRYAVTLNGKAYLYDHKGGQELSFDHKLDPAICSDPAKIREVEKGLVETTKRCTDPHAGAYWGFDLREAGG